MAKTTTKTKTIEEVPAVEQQSTAVAVATPAGGALAPVAAMHTNIGVEDMKRPNLRLLQDLSPEVKDLGMDPGQFYVDVLGIPLGNEVTFTVIGLRKRFILWNPQRNVEPMIFATSSDGISWDPDYRTGEDTAHKTFEAVIKNVGKIKWETKGSVAESGLAEFGSSVPSDKRSKPAAAKTWDVLMYLHLPDEELLPVGMSLSRSKVDAGDRLSTICFGTSLDPRRLKLKFKAVRAKGDDGEYYNISTPIRAGHLDDDTFMKMVELSKRFEKFSVDAEAGERDSAPRGPRNIDTSAVTEY